MLPTPAASQEFEPDLRSIQALFRLMKEKHNLDFTAYGRWAYQFSAADKAAAQAFRQKVEAERLKLEAKELDDGSVFVAIIVMASLTPESHHANLKRFIQIARDTGGVDFVSAPPPTPAH